MVTAPDWAGAAISSPPTVIVQGHAYRVDLGPEVQPRYHTVRKDCACDCSLDKDCPAVDAVRAHLRAGGERAPDPPPKYWATAPKLCPICGELATADRMLNSRRHGLGWRCLSDSGHYWQVRACWLRAAQERAYARSPDALGLPGVPRQTAEERAAFFKAHQIDYNVWA